MKLTFVKEDHQTQRFTTGLKNSPAIHKNLSDDIRESRPRSTLISECIEAVKKLIALARISMSRVRK